MDTLYLCPIRQKINRCGCCRQSKPCAQMAHHGGWKHEHYLKTCDECRRSIQRERRRQRREQRAQEQAQHFAFCPVRKAIVLCNVCGDPVACADASHQTSEFHGHSKRHLKCHNKRSSEWYEAKRAAGWKSTYRRDRGARDPQFRVAQALATMARSRAGREGMSRLDVQIGVAYAGHLPGNNCHLCGDPGADSIDHILPVSKGGRDYWWNLAPAHLSCNVRRGNRDVGEYKAMLAAA